MTASIGTASTELFLLSDPESAARIEELIATADTAMYVAKRSGGNQARHTASIWPLGRGGVTGPPPGEGKGGPINYSDAE